MATIKRARSAQQQNQTPIEHKPLPGEPGFENKPEEKENKPEEKPAPVTLFSPQKQSGLTAYDLNSEDLPDLDTAAIIPLDLSSAYWTPLNKGESKRVYFDRVETVQYSDPQDEDVVIELETAFFFEKVNGVTKRFSNAGKRLVAVFQNNHLERGTPVLITYLGKKKNSTNQFLSDDWSVKPLMIKV